MERTVFLSASQLFCANRAVNSVLFPTEKSLELVQDGVKEKQSKLIFHAQARIVQEFADEANRMPQDELSQSLKDIKTRLDTIRNLGTQTKKDRLS